MEKKICTKCKVVFPKTDDFFDWQNIKKGYFKSECKACRSKRENSVFWELRKPIPDGMKRCISCMEIYPATNEYFHFRYKKMGELQGECMACRSVRGKVYRKNNRDKILKSSRKSYLKHREALNSKKRENRKNNPEKYIDSNRRYNQKRRSTAKGRLSDNMTGAIYKSLTLNKNGRSWESLVGYTAGQLKRHLESLFTDGMSWDNYGEWHIDHKIPIKAFNYTKPEHEDFKRCWALSNLQPMWAKDNISKGAKLEREFQPALKI